MALPEWKSQIHTGKLRGVLSWPFSSLLVVASCRQLMLWDIQTKSQIHVLDLDFDLLDIEIGPLQAQSSALGLYVLGLNGLVFSYALQNDTITHVGKIRLLRRNDDDIPHGSLSVHDAFIAATFGKNVVVRNSNTEDKRIITAKHRYLFQGFSSRKEITLLQFLSPQVLMILSYEAGLLVTFDLQSEMRKQVLSLPFHPSSASFSRKNNIIVLHDPYDGTYLYHAGSLQPLRKLLGGAITTAPVALPAYIAFTEDERAVGIASNNGDIHIHPVNQASSFTRTHATIRCDRLYGLVLPAAGELTDTLRVVVAVHPQADTRQWQLVCWDAFTLESSN